MQLVEGKTEKVFEKLSPKEKVDFVNKGIASGLIKTQKDMDFWRDKIPPEEVSKYNSELIDFYKKSAIKLGEIALLLAENWIGCILLVAEQVEQGMPDEAKKLREGAKEEAKYFGLELEKIKESIKN